MTATPSNMVSRQVGYEQKFKDVQKVPTNLPQRVTIFSPVSDSSRRTNTNIQYNKRKSFESTQQIFDEYGICPAFYMARQLKPLSGGGVNGVIDVFPLHESSEYPTEYYLYLNGNNKKNVIANLVINGRKFNDGRSIGFTLTPTMTLDEKNKAIIDSVNSNIFSPVYAEKGITTATPKSYRTKILSNQDKLFDVFDGGLTVQTNSGTYTIKLNTRGQSGEFLTKDLTTNLTGILGVATGSFKMKDGNFAEKEIIFKNTGANNTVVTQSMHKNYVNFHDFVSSFTMTQGTYSFRFDINTKAKNAIQSTGVISRTTISALSSVTNGSIAIQTDRDASPINVTGIDFTGVTNAYDVANILQNNFSRVNAPVVVAKSNNSNRLMFNTLSSGSSASISVSATSPATGINLAGGAYLNIADGANVHGENSIEYGSLDSVVDGLVKRMNDEMLLDKFTPFTVYSTSEKKEIVFVGGNNVDSAITFTHNGYNDLTSSQYFDFANSYAYNVHGAIDSAVKMASYLNLQLKIKDLGDIVWDTLASKLKFVSKSLQDGDVFVFSAGSTGTDLTRASYFDTSNGTQTHGTAPKTTLSAVALALNDSAGTLNADVSFVHNPDDSLTISNTSTTGSSSVLTFFTATGVTEDLRGLDYLDSSAMTESVGLNGANVVVLRTKWSGATSRGLNLRVEQLSPDKDFSFIFKEVFTGVGNVDFTDAFSNFGDTWSTILINPYGVDKLDVFQSFVGSADDKTGRYVYDNFKPCVAFTGTSESDKDKLLKIAEGRALDASNSLCVAPNSEAFDFEIASAFAFLCSTVYEDSPHLTTSGHFLNDIPVPVDYVIGSMNHAEVRETLVLAGISTVTLDSNIGKFEIQDHITFRHPPTQTATAVDYKYVRNIIGIDANVAYGAIDIMKRNILGNAIVSDDAIVVVQNTIKIKDVKAIFNNLFDTLAKRALFYSSEKASDSLNVGISEVNPTRINLSFDYERSSTVKIVSTSASASFHFGGNN